MLIDLHTHTTASDGSLSPSELVMTAKDKGITAIAITDHDTINGIDEGLKIAEIIGIRLIPGVELSVDEDSGSFHLLGLGIDYQYKPLLDVLERVRNSRNERNSKIIVKLNELGFKIDFKDIYNSNPNQSVGRAHIAQALMNSGQIPSIESAFKGILNKGGSAYFDRFRLTLEKACELIHNAGGAAVWAHPGLHGKELDALLENVKLWKAIGLDGIESDYSTHSIELRDKLRAIAVTNNMIYTGGSDFHGDVKPDIQLGKGPEGHPVGVECLDNFDRLISYRRMNEKA